MPTIPKGRQQKIVTSMDKTRYVDGLSARGYALPGPSSDWLYPQLVQNLVPSGNCAPQFII